MRARFLAVPILWTVFYLPQTHGALQFDFSGTFTECDAACQAASLDVLLNTSFSGSILVPETGTDLRPAANDGFPINDANIAEYVFDSPSAFFSFDSEVDAFDLESHAPLTVWVQSCPTDLCTFNQNFVWLTTTIADRWYGLYLNTVGEKLGEVTTPSIDVLRTLNPFFDIEPIDNSASVSTSFVFPSEMSLTITTVPLPAAVWLLLGGLGLLCGFSRVG